jgi:hypothetical protein
MARIAKDYGYTLAELRKLSDDDHMSSTLRAEFFFEDEANTWHYRAPALHINGGDTTTREDAQRECLDAIAFALEGDPSPVPRGPTLTARRPTRPRGIRSALRAATRSFEAAPSARRPSPATRRR